MYVGSAKFRSAVGAQGEWSECNDAIKALAYFSGQYNYGHYLKEVLDSDIPVLVYTGD